MIKYRYISYKFYSIVYFKNPSGKSNNVKVSLHLALSFVRTITQYTFSFTSPFLCILSFLVSEPSLHDFTLHPFPVLIIHLTGIYRRQPVSRATCETMPAHGCPVFSAGVFSLQWRPGRAFAAAGFRRPSYRNEGRRGRVERDEERGRGVLREGEIQVRVRGLVGTRSNSRATRYG